MWVTPDNVSTLTNEGWKAGGEEPKAKPDPKKPAAKKPAAKKKK